MRNVVCWFEIFRKLQLPKFYLFTSKRLRIAVRKHRADSGYNKWRLERPSSSFPSVVLLCSKLRTKSDWVVWKAALKVATVVCFQDQSWQALFLYIYIQASFCEKIENCRDTAKGNAAAHRCEAWDSEMSLSSFLLLPISVAIQEGLFGPKAPVPAARPRLGDFLGLSLGASTLVTPSVPWNWHTNRKTFHFCSKTVCVTLCLAFVTRDCDNFCIFL